LGRTRTGQRPPAENFLQGELIMAMRARGGSGAIGAAVLFAIIAVLAVILAVIFHTQKTEVQVSLADAQDQVDKWVTENEKTRIAAMIDMSSIERTHAGQLMELIDLHKSLLTSDSGKSFEAIRVSLDLEPGKTVQNELDRLRAEEQSDKQLIDQLTHERDAAVVRRAVAEQEKASLQQKHEQTVAELSAQLSMLKAEYDAATAKAQSEIEALTAHLTTTRKDLTGKLSETRQKRDELAAKNVALEKKIAEITSSRNIASSVDPSRLVDGEIVAVLEVDRVYVDLGVRDKVPLGITFEVFDQVDGVTPDTNGNYRGKATVEVINVGEDSAVCRVVRRPLRGTTINEGDVIANPVYDRDAVYRFHVFGQFDIDNTGRATAFDRRRIETMISQWGGQLSNELGANIDFLVLGRQPQRLAPPTGSDKLNPQKLREFADSKKRFGAYQGLVAEAKNLSIPILNQNRFLAMVGYYRR
jgi:hypothetical protein